MLLSKLNPHSKCSLACALLVVVAALSIASVRVVAAEAVTAAGEGPRSLAEPQSLPLVQVTTDPAADNSPALVQAADGKLLTVFVRNGELWSRTSTDGGATWAAETPIAGCCRSNPSLLRAADGTLWLAYGRDGTIWYRTSVDQGATWLTESQIPPDGRDDSDPVIFQAVDGKLWVVWRAYRLYEIGGGVIVEEVGLWYKTSTDGGATWSAETRLTTGSDFAPAATVTSAGRVMVVWQRYDELWQRTSSNAGVTWSAETRIAGCCRRKPSMAAVGGVLWLAYENDGNIWYRTSANQGTSWSTEAPFTRFVGPDYSAALTALASGKPGFAWNSVRSGNPDIWFGIPGERDDFNPPPYVEWIEHRPQCNLDSTTPIIFRARALDETDVVSVRLTWTLNGVPQPDLPMFDDGAHGDDEIGDGVWGVQRAPLPINSQVSYAACATDTDGNNYCYPAQNSFTVQAPFTKTADILFVPDGGGYETSWFSSYYTNALDALGYDYDIWDTARRCAPDSAILNQYTAGAIIWAVPYEGYITRNNDSRTAVQSYLSAGGKLFITGQDIAQFLSWSGNPDFLNNYLHATFRQQDTGLYALSCDGLVVNISGGAGANNQYSKDEVDPVAPAEIFCTYRAGASAMLVEPIRPAGEASTNPLDMRGMPTPVMPGTLQNDAPAAPVATPTAAPSAAPAGCVGSCTAALRVDTGIYKVVYFAFGFEGINSVAHRGAIMERVLAWLNGTSPRPTLVAPRDGQSVPAGDIDFTWIGVPGGTRYELQIDAVATFDSPELIDVTVSTTSYMHTFGAHDARYWRVRALPDDGQPDAWTPYWSFATAADLVQVTTDPADDTAPALAQTGDGNLLTVFVRNGNLWSRASADDGATWTTERQITGCCRYNPSLSRAADGTLWLAYDLDGDIWYRTSIDHGVTWAAERKLPTDPNSTNDYDPVILPAADGKLWVVWNSFYRGEYYRAIWYKTSADGGITWTADTRLSSGGFDNGPAATVAPDGRVVVVWWRYDGLWQRSSSDGGVNWSAETRISEGDRYHPSLAPGGQDLWLVYEKAGSLWYRTSANQGDTWSDEVRFTRFTGADRAPATAALSSGSVGITWNSMRSANPDIWFGIPGERDDLNPPPYIEWLDHQPAPNPDSDDPIIFRTRARDEVGVAIVHLLWTLDGVAQADLPMFDDGTHGDTWAGDGIWSVEHAPLPEGSQVTYRVRALDTDGNSYRYPGLDSFKLLPAFVKTAAILFVPDAGSTNTPSDTAWFRSYYTDALESLGYRYDIWDTELRGAPGSAILSQYTHGAVIWAVPYWGYATDGGSDTIWALQAYLDAGGKLFITGQNIAERVSWSGFLNTYLHAAFKNADTGLYALSGATGDPIGNGLALNISGGDGANDQYSKDEVDPIAPAEVIFTYRAGASAMLAEPIRPTEGPASSEDTSPPLSQGDMPPRPAVIPPPTPYPAPTAAPVPVPTAVSSGVCTGSCTAGLRVDTGKYRVVYFAFGFEAINSATDRNAVMERVLNWLKPTQRRLYLPLIFAQP